MARKKGSAIYPEAFCSNRFSLGTLAAIKALKAKYPYMARDTDVLRHLVRLGIKAEKIN